MASDDGRGKSDGSRRTYFPKGASGNKSGRPPGAKGLRSVLKAELDEFVSITADGKTRRVRKRAVIIKALVAKAAKGDVRAADKIISLMIQAEGFEDQRSSKTELSETDQQIIDQLLGMSEEPDYDQTDEPAARSEDRSAIDDSEADREGGRRR